MHKGRSRKSRNFAQAGFDLKAKSARRYFDLIMLHGGAAQCCGLFFHNSKNRRTGKGMIRAETGVDVSFKERM